MPRGKQIESRGISIKQGTHIGRNFAVAALRRFARAEQMFDIIDLCPVAPDDRTRPRARHRDNLLDRFEIILGMSIGQPIRRIGIGLAKDMRHTKFIAHYPRVILAFRRRRSRRCNQWFPNRSADSKRHYQPGCNRNPLLHRHLSST